MLEVIITSELGKLKEFFDFTNPEFLSQLFAILINVVLAGIMSQLIHYTYLKCGKTFSDRKSCGSYFLIITLCTTVIITIIQSSLALSLGLVGALSIVRFRSAVKEQEELAYIFLCIAVGLGFGANMQAITIAVCLLILLVIIIRTKTSRKSKDISYNLTVITSAMHLKHIETTLNEHAKEVIMKRFDDAAGKITVCYFVDFSCRDNLSTAVEALKQKDEQVIVSFVSDMIV